MNGLKRPSILPLIALLLILAAHCGPGAVGEVDGDADGDGDGDGDSDGDGDGDADGDGDGDGDGDADGDGDGDSDGDADGDGDGDGDSDGDADGDGDGDPACLGAGDLAIVGGVDLNEPLERCGRSCGSAGDVAGCLAECLLDEYGLSAACAACYGDRGACALDACGSACHGDLIREDCVGCQEEVGCFDEFDDCSGLGGEGCVSDGRCEESCPGDDDPDCEPCGCDRSPTRCDAAAEGSTSDCECDPNCDGDDHACDGNGYCDPWCPEGFDFDCGVCECDYYRDVCEAAEIASTEDCACDRDCTSGHSACEGDAHCDTWCPGDADPDCDGCSCDYNPGICEPGENGSTSPCTCDPDCADGAEPCVDDGHCDTWCDPDGVCQDPDCQGATGSGYHTGSCSRT